MGYGEVVFALMFDTCCKAGTANEYHLFSFIGGLEATQRQSSCFELGIESLVHTFIEHIVSQFHIYDHVLVFAILCFGNG